MREAEEDEERTRADGAEAAETEETVLLEGVRVEEEEEEGQQVEDGRGTGEREEVEEEVGGREGRMTGRRDASTIIPSFSRRSLRSAKNNEF
jgi:hypothetical protein